MATLSPDEGTTVTSVSSVGTIPITYIVTYTYPLTSIITTIGDLTTTTLIPITTIPTTLFDGATPQSTPNLLTSVDSVATDPTSSSSAVSSDSSFQSGHAGSSSHDTSTSTSVISTSTSVSYTSTPTSSPSPSGGLGGGAVAGIAIACALVGTIVGALIVFFVIKRRRGLDSFPGHTTDQEYQTKAALEHPSFTNVSDGLPLTHFLPAPTPDKDLARELQALGFLIQQHVENYYHLKPVSVDPSAIAGGLSDLGLGRGKGMSTSHLATLALDPSTRQFALQHVVSCVTFGNLVADPRAVSSMLPPSVTAFTKELPPRDQRRGNAEGMFPCILFDTAGNKSAKMTSVDDYAFNRWRQLSSYLLNADRSDRGYLKPRQSVSQQARRLGISLARCLDAFVEGSNSQAQTSHMEQVVMECTKFGYLVFSQPGQLRYEFTTNSPQELVTHPGLSAVRDETGRRQEPPRRILAPTVAAV